MGRGTKSNHSSIQFTPRMIIHSLVWAAVLFSPATLAAPITDNPASVARATLDKRVNWSFNGYSAGQACRGLGNTSGGGSSNQGCSPIDSRGVTQYSYNGGGAFKMTGYLNAQCTGEELVSVNGGSVTCLEAPVNWSGYLISAAT